MTELKKPLETEVLDQEGNIKTFTISRLPALVGREVMAKYISGNSPKIGEYQVSEEAMLLLFQYIEHDGIRLINKDLINNHVDDANQLITLEFRMLQYNSSLLGGSGNKNILDVLMDKLMTRLLPHLGTMTEQVSSFLGSIDTRQTKTRRTRGK